MPLLFLERFPWPSLQTYAALSVVLLAGSILSAYTAVKDLAVDSPMADDQPLSLEGDEEHAFRGPAQATDVLQYLAKDSLLVWVRNFLCIASSCLVKKKKNYIYKRNLLSCIVHLVLNISFSNYYFFQVLVNTACCLLMLVAKMIQCMVFGPLRVSEKQVSTNELCSFKSASWSSSLEGSGYTTFYYSSIHFLTAYTGHFCGMILFLSPFLIKTNIIPAIFPESWNISCSNMQVIAWHVFIKSSSCLLSSQHLKDKFWNFIFYKFIFIFGVLNVQNLEEVISWCLWFAVLVFLHLMVQLCKDRFEYVGLATRGRCCWSLCLQGINSSEPFHTEGAAEMTTLIRPLINKINRTIVVEFSAVVTHPWHFMLWTNICLPWLVSAIPYC